ncbi:MAG: amidohydrolase [Deltaproteobacteria bacterium]|nr:amidohydrolase [Deltaproteobacteria bacterium]
MDKMFVNGVIQTLTGAGPAPEAVGVGGGCIEAVGSEAEIRGLASGSCKVIDLKGAVLFPGFIDCHNHLMIFGYFLDGLDISPAQVGRIDDILSLVKAQADQVRAGDWIKGSRFIDYQLAENRYPTRHDLDAVSPNNPVILYHTSFHACVLNSLALDELNITAETEPPAGGLIEKDPQSGQPSGILHDAAMMDVFNQLFSRDMAAMPVAQRVEICSRATAEFAAKGLVGAADALVTPLSLRIYQETLAAGRLKIRIYTMNEIAAAEGLLASGLFTGFGGDWLKLGPIKIFEDGGMSNRTAAVSTLYLTQPESRGLKVVSREELIAAIGRAHGLGFQVAVHSQGDAGLADTLDAFASVLGPRSDNPLRHRIEHAGCLYPPLLARAAGMKIGISIQPAFFSSLGDGWIEAFGLEGAQRLYPFKSMLKAGLPLGLSSDCPVVSPDPRIGLRDAVLRKTGAGVVLGPEEALSMNEALRLYTLGAAYLSFDENAAGTIEAGKRADFTVLAADPRSIPPEEVADIPFRMTVVGGEVMFSEE